MAEATYKRGDTWPPFRRVLQQDVDGTVSAIDLTTADSIKLLMESEDGLTSLEKVATVVGTASDGEVEVDWETGDLAVVGVYNCEFEITWDAVAPDIETVPNGDYFQIDVVQDLG
jgi:hypothetical protein